MFFLMIQASFYSQKFISIKDYGVDGMEYKNESQAEKSIRYSKIKKAFENAINTKSNLFFPKGVYDVGNKNFPFRTSEDVKGDELLDCKGITIYGEKGTVLKTTSDYGADVLQLNKVKNLTIKDIEITAVLLNFTQAGSNGISITNGFDNIYLDNIRIYNLPGVPLEYDIDGSKGFTIQTAKGNKAFKGKIVAKKIVVENCGYGFRFDTADVNDMLDFQKTLSIDVDIDVKKAFQGISIEFGASTKPVDKNSALKINVNATLDNCQQYIRFARVFGGTYNIVTKKTNENFRFPNTNDKRRFGLVCNYIKNATVNMKGNVGTVDNKFLIGAVGSIVEPHNLANRTENCVFNFDITGKSLLDDFSVINYLGDSINDSEVNISARSLDKNSKLKNKLALGRNKVKINTAISK